jgi:hypothetical protein
MGSDMQRRGTDQQIREAPTPPGSEHEKVSVLGLFEEHSDRLALPSRRGAFVLADEQLDVPGLDVHGFLLRACCQRLRERRSSGRSQRRLGGVTRCSVYARVRRISGPWLHGPPSAHLDRTSWWVQPPESLGP